MTRKIILIWIIIVGSELIYAQDFLVQSPQQLGLGSSTARVGNWVYAGSALAQAYYSNQSRATLSLYIPYTQLTDGKIRTNAFKYYTPSYRWGALSMGYVDYSVDNFDKQVMGVSSMQIGYTNVLFNRLIIASNLRWQKETWYSDWQKPLNLDGTALDISAIYILGGYSSLGFSMTNVLRKSYSSIKNDAASREIRLGYSWLDNSVSFSLESGVIAEEDAFLEINYGGYINSEISFPHGFRVGAEYKRLFYNEIGAVLSFNYRTSSFNAEISYGIRLDDSPMPISTLRHSWGLHLTLNHLKSESSLRNPQILLRDNSAPDIKVKRISDYTVFMRNDETDIFKLETRLKDEESGLNSINFSIVSAGDTTDILYTRNYTTSENTFTDTIQFDGYTQDGEFFENGRYLARISASDAGGNENLSNFIPFRVLSKRNDSEGPEISMSFDTSELVLEESESSTLLNSHVSIEDKEGDWVLWKVQLFKMGDDSVWRGLKPATGGIEISKRKFSWLLKNSRSRPIQGDYKIKVEAKDEISNSSVRWSDIKTIIQIEPEQQEPDFVQQESADDSKTIIEETALPAVVYLPEEIDSDMTDDPFKQFNVAASYYYRGREVKLSDFTFFEGQKFDPYLNQLSLSVLGVYLQDIPQAKLVTEFPRRLGDVQGFETELRNFLNEAYDIENTRIVFKHNSENSRLYFYIKE